MPITGRGIHLSCSWSLSCITSSKTGGGNAFLSLTIKNRLWPFTDEAGSCGRHLADLNRGYAQDQTNQITCVTSKITENLSELLFHVPELTSRFHCMQELSLRHHHQDSVCWWWDSYTSTFRWLDKLLLNSVLGLILTSRVEYLALSD